MSRFFNVAADCKPGLHYMVDIEPKLKKMKVMIDRGEYFTINRARQYGKTTTLRALYRYLQNDFYVVLIDFQTFGAGEFEDEHVFSLSFSESFLWELKQNHLPDSEKLTAAMEKIEARIDAAHGNYRLKKLFMDLSNICAAADKPVVLMIDEVDSASNNQVFLDFLAQLRAYYINRDRMPTFQSVILAGVHDVKNLRRKLRPEDEHKINSPWNIASDFNIDMSFSAGEIAGMLREYEDDYHTGMDIPDMAKGIYDYTSGYPFLVSRLCKLMDEEVCGSDGFETRSKSWTKAGLNEAVKRILEEKNTLFESLSGKLITYPEMNLMLESLLFTGKNIAYNADNIMIDTAAMFGFVKNQNGTLMIANRIFETRLYNYYLSTADMQKKDIYAASLLDRNQFITDGRLNMRLILEKFVVHFNDLYGDHSESFIEEEGRKYFLLYLRPIINGTGNYYIEAQTRGLRRTDVIVDYHGEQYIIEMKIWHGDEYHRRGEQQLMDYLDDYHVDKGYMLSFNFNKNKQIGVQEIVVGDKVLIEAVV